MRVSRLFQSLLSVSLAASLIVLSFSSVQALERVRWKMQSAWGSQVKILGETGLYISDTIKTISGNIEANNGIIFSVYWSTRINYFFPPPIYTCNIGITS